MKQAPIVVIALLCAALISGCTIMGSTGGNKAISLPAKGGMAYSLPKALLDVKLSDIGGDLVLTVSGPIYVPDQEKTYLLQYKPNPFASDTVELTVDPKTSLLQTVNGTAEDKTGQVIIQLARAAAMIAQSAQEKAAGEIVIYERRIDPAHAGIDQKIEKEMNEVAKAHAEIMFKKTCPDKPTQNLRHTIVRTPEKKIAASASESEKKKALEDTQKAEDIAEAEKESRIASSCASYELVANKGANIQFHITTPEAPLNAEPADCSIGACYRVPAPYEIEFKFNGQYSYNTTVYLPNGQPPLVIPLDRTAFVRRVNNVDFENGMLKKAHFEKPSEALEVASLPVSVTTAVIESISTLIQARIDISDKEKALAESQTQLLDAQNKLEEKRVGIAQSAAKEETQVLLKGSSGGRVVLGKVPAIPQPPAGNGQSGNLFSPGNPGTRSPGGK